jgi:hypothetical protein
MPDLYAVVWHGAIAGFVPGWSRTKGELTAPQAQTQRPACWVPPPPEEVDALGLPRQGPAQTAEGEHVDAAPESRTPGAGGSTCRGKRKLKQCGRHSPRTERR